MEFLKPVVLFGFANRVLHSDFHNASANFRQFLLVGIQAINNTALARLHPGAEFDNICLTGSIGFFRSLQKGSAI